MWNAGRPAPASTSTETRTPSSTCSVAPNARTSMDAPPGPGLIVESRGAVGDVAHARCTVRALSTPARIAVVLAALLLGLACRERAAAPVGARPSEFDGGRAFRDLEALVALGPRPAGSAAAGDARALIRERLRQAGWRVEAHDFSVPRPDGRAVAMTNLIARRVDAADVRTLVVTHYDTKNLAGVAFVGANDGASGVAVLLELARVTASDEPPLPVELVFFDGEEAFGANITRRRRPVRQHRAGRAHGGRRLARKARLGGAGRHGRRQGPEPRARPRLRAGAAGGLREGRPGAGLPAAVRPGFGHDGDRRSLAVRRSAGSRTCSCCSTSSTARAARPARAGTPRAIRSRASRPTA